jgi:hypothetical protein
MCTRCCRQAVEGHNRGRLFSLGKVPDRSWCNRLLSTVMRCLAYSFQSDPLHQKRRNRARGHCSALCGAHSRHGEPLHHSVCAYYGRWQARWRLCSQELLSRATQAFGCDPQRNGPTKIVPRGYRRRTWRTIRGVLRRLDCASMASNFAPACESSMRAFLRRWCAAATL